MGRASCESIRIHWPCMPLWRQTDFVKLWAGQAISLLGSQVQPCDLTESGNRPASHARPDGPHRLADVLPLVLFGLPTGLWVDRARRRPIMIATDIGRAILLASIPLAALAGRLGMPQLYVVSFGMGAMTALFRVACGSLLPSVVGRSGLDDGNPNSRLPKQSRESPALV